VTTAVSAPAAVGAPDEPPRRRHLVQIDVLKGAAILGVLAQHGLSASDLHAVGADLWIRQAVPIFFILMGLNAAGSYARRGSRRLRELASRDYWRGRLARLGIPFAVTFVASLVLGAVLGEERWGPTILVGRLPFSGPGNYFVTILFTFAVAFPVLYALWRRSPWGFIAFCFAADAAFELLAGQVQGWQAARHPYAYEANLLRYLGAIAIGVWLSECAGLRARRNRWLVALAPVGLTWVAWLELDQPHIGWLIPSFALGTNVLAALWAALLVLVTLALVPGARMTRLLQPLAGLGRASYHVFLAQILVFGALASTGFATLALGGAGSIAIGWLAFRLLPVGLQPKRWGAIFSARRRPQGNRPSR
jgi:peptidoglycan/LPS O-acetylase OafA/YrhL